MRRSIPIALLRSSSRQVARSVFSVREPKCSTNTNEFDVGRRYHQRYASGLQALGFQLHKLHGLETFLGRSPGPVSCPRTARASSRRRNKATEHRSCSSSTGWSSDMALRASCHGVDWIGLGLLHRIGWSGPDVRSGMFPVPPPTADGASSVAGRARRRAAQRREGGGEETLHTN